MYIHYEKLWYRQGFQCSWSRWSALVVYFFELTNYEECLFDDLQTSIGSKLGRWLFALGKYL